MKKISVPAAARKKAPVPLAAKILVPTISVLAILLTVLTFIDMAGYHLLFPEVVPLGCVLELLLLMGWVATHIWRRRTDERKQRITMLVSVLVILIAGMFLTNYVLQYVQVLMPSKYDVVKSPSGEKVAVLSMIDSGFGSNEETLAMLQRMEERQAYHTAKAAGEELTDYVAPEIPSAVHLDENGQIIYHDSGILSYSLDNYDFSAYGYIYGAYPIRMGLFYTSNVSSEGLVYRGVESEAKLMSDWLDDSTLSLYLENAEPGDSGTCKLSMAN